ncbi:RidA family protein [Mesorhizobium australicum]|uniref:RidA family protein n=1 Tax=Mesorhizobium australicum TaxID=536018 RepID=UPI0033383B6E
MTASTPPFSALRRTGDTIYLSGELGFDDTGKISGDIVQQTQTTLRRIEATLAGAGLSRRDIVSCTCYLVRKEDFPGFNQAYRAVFSEDPLPVRATVVADLVLDALIEISAVAQSSDK